MSRGKTGVKTVQGAARSGSVTRTRILTSRSAQNCLAVMNHDTATINLYVNTLLDEANIVEGETLSFTLASQDSALAVELASEAYRRGAGYVDVFYEDPDLLTPDGAEVPEWQKDRFKELLTAKARFFNIAPSEKAFSANCPMTDQELARYTINLAKYGLNVEAGDYVVIDATPEQSAMCVSLAEQAYQLGAGYVDIVYNDEKLRKARMQYANGFDLAPDSWLANRKEQSVQNPKTTFLSIIDNDNLELFADVDPDRFEQESQTRTYADESFDQEVNNNNIRWSIAQHPSVAWASQVYSQMNQQDAQRQLAEDILYFARCSDNDAPDAWETHVNSLRERSDKLTELNLQGLRFKGAGTELEVGIPEQSRFLPIEWKTNQGKLFACNFPAEEIFTTPDPEKVNGSFHCTRPVRLDNRLVTGIKGQFLDGKLVAIEADTPQMTQIVQNQFTDENALRMGEIALVPTNGRIGSNGITYNNTFFDENATCHFALGDSYQIATKDKYREAGVDLGNHSDTHLDLMIGDQQLDVYGIGPDGQEIALIINGEYQI